MNKALRIAVLLAAVAPLATLGLLNDHTTDSTDAVQASRSFVDAFPTAQAGFAMRRPADHV